MTSIFITGTDTDVGKTYVSVALLNQLNAAGYQTFGVKPIASGCEMDSNGQLINSDALALLEAASIKQSYATVNPIALSEAIAPHIAATHAGIQLSLDKMVNHIKQSTQANADFNLIEGAGGWCVPLNQTELVSDVIASLRLPVILVVGMKLGCLNHAILTCHHILAKKCSLLGWVANCVDPAAIAVDENIQTLRSWLPVPCLGVVPYAKIPDFTKQYIDLELMLDRISARVELRVE